jgi:hypothetical protein
MFARCSNPECGVPFDYREGQLIPIRTIMRNGQPPAGHHGVEHYWLCGRCSEVYMLEHERGAGIKMKPRTREVRDVSAPSLVTAA